jgi:hypothetical protein
MNKRLHRLIVLGILFHARPVSAQAINPDLIAQANKEGRVAWYTTVSIPESKLKTSIFPSRSNCFSRPSV